MKPIIFTLFSICFTAIHAQVKDIDGNNYSTTTYNEFEWTTDNLQVSRFRNGDVIIEARTAEAWSKAANDGTPAWCWYEFKTGEGGTNIKVKLYNGWAVTDERGLAPKGWSIPNSEDWNNAPQAHKDPEASAKFMNKQLTANSVSEYGISCRKHVFPCRTPEGKIDEINGVGGWWNPSYFDLTFDYGRCTGLDGALFADSEDGEWVFARNWKGYGFMVRCVKK
jgi:hypothetical protein